jgi:YidC/Oxa1 family membrane protein insertase
MNILDLLRSTLFVAAHGFGGSFGAAIIAASIALRVAMLPLTLPATRRRLIRERRERELAPALAELKKKYAKDPARLQPAMQELYAAHGLSLVDSRSMLDSLIQYPPAALLYGAIARSGRDAGSFLWMSNLVSPDRALAVVASVVSIGTAWLAARSPESSQAVRLLPLAITGVITYVLLSHFSAAVGLYSITSSVVMAAERALARRSLDRAPA